MKNIAFVMILLYSLAYTQERFPKAIEDNSFLIEEAYNQEDRVVQHISNLVYTHHSNFEYSFTQEWPVFSQTHQLSYTVPYSWLAKNLEGVGDIFINYRYQLFTKQNWVTVSPRFSIILPTGDKTMELGTGKVSYQVNLPISKRLAKSWVTHWNAGFRITPNIATGSGRKNIFHYNLGTSFIWLAATNLNMMMELYSVWDQTLNSARTLTTETVQVVNSGIRYALELGTLQIVPGASFQWKFAEGEKSTGFFFYLSFEHPF